MSTSSPVRQRLRRIARPVVRRVRRATQPDAVARLITAGLVDREYYEAQAGRAFTDDRAVVTHLLAHGAEAGLTCHPLIEPDWSTSGWAKTWRGGLTDDARLASVLKGLLSATRCGRTSPVFDAEVWTAQHPDAAAHRGGPLAHFVRTASAGTPLPAGDQLVGAAPTWREFRTRALVTARDYAAADAAADRDPIEWEQLADALPARVPGRVSVLIPTFQDHAMTVRAVLAVLESESPSESESESEATGTAPDVEVVVIDNGSRRSVTALLRTVFAADDRVTNIRLARNHNFSGGSNAAFAASTGATVVFLNNDTTVQANWLAPLVAPLTDPHVLGTQPLLLFPDGLVQSAGTVFLADGHVASAFLTGHPPEDARRDSGRGFRVVTAAALAMRAADVVALRGFDDVFANGMEDVDLCLRAGDRDPEGEFRVVSSSVVVHHEGKSPGRGAHIPENRRVFVDRWRDRLTYAAEGRARYAALGFTVDSVQGDGVGNPAPRPVLGRPDSAYRATSADELPTRLRWSLHIASPAGVPGEAWGDTHFARAIADGLVRRGQQVALMHHHAHDNPVAHLDDVALTIRGLDRVAPQPGAVNMLWVISHPDLVTVAELREYDVVAAASISWAHEMTELSGRTVHPLLQATDPTRFAPHPGAEPGHDALFVGVRPKERARPIVDAALEARVDLAVYGNGWDGLLPPGVLRGRYLPNEQLGEAYARAGVVLNDHWADMAAAGFLNNRLFDAVAAGARIVSDRVAGIEEIFGEAVRIVDGPADLARLCGPDRDTYFLPEHERVEAAERIRREHTFDARAGELLDLARAEWTRRVPSDAGLGRPKPHDS